MAIHPTAIVAPGAQLDPSCQVGAYAVIGPEVKMGPGTVVDPQKEAQRLKENAAIGKAPTEGDTPVIRKKKKAIFEGIF